MDIRTIGWTGTNGNALELRAYSETKMVEREIDSDGYIVKCGAEPKTTANLELWVDGKKIDSCWDVNFWQVIDVANCGYKKVWGLKLMMTPEQAEKVDHFLKTTIEDGKTPEVKAYEAAKKEKSRQNTIADAERIIKAAETTRKNADGSLMTNEQAKTWRRRYNDAMNEGGEGYVPEVITQEMYDRAKLIVGK